MDSNLGIEVNKETRARWWLVTFNMQAEHEIPWEEMLVKAQPLGLDFMTGQMESAPTTGTRHWHLVIHTAKVQRPTALLKAFGLGTNVKVITAGTEDRVIAYVTKEDTRVCGPYVEGTRPVKRNSATDWDRVREAAVAGDFAAIPSNVLVAHYNNIKAIHKDHVAGIRLVRVLNNCLRFYNGKVHQAIEIRFEASSGSFAAQICAETEIV